MLNWIWLAFILVAVLVGGFTGRLPEMTKDAFDHGEGGGDGDRPAADRHLGDLARA